MNKTLTIFLVILSSICLVGLGAIYDQLYLRKPMLVSECNAFTSMETGRREGCDVNMTIHIGNTDTNMTFYLHSTFDKVTIFK